MTDKITKTDAEWRSELSPEEYRITRRKGTERAFTGACWQMDGKQGTYCCRCCNLPLFNSGDKFDSGTGWPSFHSSVSRQAVAEVADNTLFMRRTEVTCARCDAHLGHVFPDGPAPTGLRYCINSASLTFRDAESEA